MGLKEYNRKRDFSKTGEPGGKKAAGKHKLPIFVVQEHHASTHHFDFRLEAEGVLKSWAVPKGPSMSPADKRLAVQVEDHPLSYATFHGDIPEGQYGAGHVEVWDKGTYEPADESSKTVPDALERGRLSVTLHGRKLKGTFSLVRTRPTARQPQWLLIKRTDEFSHKESQGDPRGPKAKKARKAKPVPPKRAAPKGPTAVVHSTSRPDAVTFSHPDKLLYPQVRLSKQGVADYYRRVSHVILPYLKNRPVTVERYPAGVGSKSPRFWQKNLPKEAPGWVPRVELPNEEGKAVQYGLINDVETLMWFVNQNALTYHIYLSTVDDLERPDFVLFDLDPGKVAMKEVVAVAKTLHGILAGREVEGYLKTSGKSGLHVMTRPPGDATDYDAARAWAESVANDLVKEHPKRATTERSINKRKGRIYVDVVQNALGHHFVSPYSLRATPTATASTPLLWKEVTPKLDPAAFDAKTLPRRVSAKGDPMADLLAG